MAGADRSAASFAPTSQTKREALSADDQKELDLLDGTFDRLKAAIPAAPYILSTPSLHPYTHYSRHEARSWMMGNLFQPDEEHLQYRTFNFREPYNDCFVLQPGEDEEPEAERPKSQASNTLPQGAKKKISLSAYKSKQANGIITPSSKKLSPNLPPTKSTVTTNGMKEIERPSEIVPKSDVPKGHKRSAPEPLESEKPEKRAKDESDTSRPVMKSDSTDSVLDVDKSAPSNATPHGLPPLLSPVDQPLNNPYGLPAILSPTLPSNIQAELDRLETQRKRGDSNASTSSSDRKSQLLTVPDSHAQKREENVRPNNRVCTVSVGGKSPNATSVTQSTTSGPSRIVKLKYGKRQAATIAQILRLPPTRKPAPMGEKKERQDSAKENFAKANAKTADVPTLKIKDAPKAGAPRSDNPTPSSKPNGTSTRVAEKRQRTDDDASLAVPSKRPKAADRPSTPIQQTLASPAMSNKSSVQKSQGPFTTPRKDLKSINMLRSASNEGYDATPGRSGTTPSAKNLDAKAAPTSTPTTDKKQADLQSLSQTSQKLNQKGRSLKHEAQRIIEKGRSTKEEQKRAAVTSLECILSYMAAYTAQDQSQSLRGRQAEVELTWKTLLPLCGSFAKYTENFPHLAGLRLYLGAVIAAAICAHVAPRASRLRSEPKAQDSPHDGSAEQAKQHALQNENFILQAKHYMQLVGYTQDARVTLPMEDVQKQFPRTWAAQEPNVKLAKEPEKITGTKLSGPYFLPIQIDTTPIQAVRFGLKFLGEFCEKEKLDYTLHINLDKPE